MRHRVVGRKLGTDREHRISMLRNLSDSLILHGQIVTTLAKAKYLRPYVEKLITKAKSDKSFTSIKRVGTKLSTSTATRKLFEEVAPLFEQRPGGYTRIVRVGYRDGDKAEMARIELLDFEKTQKKQSAKKPSQEKPKKTEGAKTSGKPKTRNSTRSEKAASRGRIAKKDEPENEVAEKKDENNE